MTFLFETRTALRMLTCLFAVTLMTPMRGNAESPNPAAASTLISINENWRFNLGEHEGAESVAFDDGGWETIDLPHTWNNLDGQDGGDDYHRGTGWYRRRLEIPADAKNRRYFLRIGAASMAADVYLNGVKLGRHVGGFAAFCYELTPHIRFGEQHVLAVRVDNSHDDNVPPWSADFTFFGGLYRGAELLVTNALCISPLDYASPGVKIEQRNVSPERGDVVVRTQTSNGAKKPVDATVSTTITDRDGHAVASSESKHIVDAEGLAVAEAKLTVDKPHLWNGVDDPYLYEVRVRVSDGDRIVDEQRHPLGLRFFRVDPDRGFFLNGKPYRLYGVNRHQDRINKGWAIGKAEHDEDFALIREMGCTAVRLAHYQHDAYVYDLCDRLGLIVWAEIPLVDRINDTESFTNNCRQQLIELIRQNRNHPSILFWGVHNEITAPWKPGPDAGPLVGELARLAKSEDPTRLTVCAATDPPEHPANWQTDLTAFNRYFGWYGGEPEELGDWLDKMHADHPKSPLGVSEYGAGASILHHEDPPKKPKHDGEWHPEEWQARVHEQSWTIMRQRPYLWCVFVWNMFDFAVDRRSEGDTAGRNDKGLVTYDRKTRKDAFYWYKANWSDEPMIHITSKRFTDRKDPNVNVRVYSNLDEVTLTVNGKPIGQRRSDNHIFEWTDVTLSPGENTIRAAGKSGTTQTEDGCRWTYELVN